MPGDVPSFDEWVVYCFEHGRADFQATAEAKGGDHSAIEEREARFGALSSTQVAEYCWELFSSPGFLAERYSDDQIADATWFLFGIGSSYLRAIRAESVPRELQVDVVRSVSAMYTELFDRVCDRGEGADVDVRSSRPIDIAVSMIWDMECIATPLHKAAGLQHLVDPCFEVLETALLRCASPSCKRSALHGLGHVCHHHPDRVRALIGRYYALPGQPEWLDEYAVTAWRGAVL
jgi:hypothetical protein